MVLKSLPEEYSKPFLPCFRVLKKCNVHFFDDRPIFFKILPYFYMLPSVVIYVVALTIHLIVAFKTGSISLDELVDVVPVYVVCVQTIFQTAIIISNKKKIESMIVRLGHLWRTEGLSEGQICKKNVLLKRLKVCHTVFYWTYLLGSWHYILGPVLEIIIQRYILPQDYEFKLPFKCYFPFDPLSSWDVYIATYLFEGYSMITIVYGHLGTDLLLIIICSHLATEFTLIQEDFLHAKPTNQSISHVNELDECSSDSDIYADDEKSLNDFIRRHQILIGLAQDLDDVFNKMIFVDLFAATISICFFGFAAKVAQANAFSILNSFIAVVGSIMPIFNLCFYGEILKSASEGVSGAVYNNRWYKGNKNYVTSIFIILQRSQKPCCLSSLKYNPVSLITFTKVLSTTWSYFSLASSVYEEDTEGNA